MLTLNLVFFVIMIVDCQNDNDGDDDRSLRYIKETITERLRKEMFI